MSPEQFAQQVAKGAADHADRALARRRPDLRRAPGHRAPPPDELAGHTLDRLDYTAQTVARINEDLTARVIEARSLGASWARVGIAIGESAQTAFNRYRRYEAPSAPETGPQASPRRTRKGG